MRRQAFRPSSIDDCERWIAEYAWLPDFDYPALPTTDRSIFESELTSIIRFLSWEIDRLQSDQWSTAIGHAGGLSSVAGLGALAMPAIATFGAVATIVGGGAALYGYGRHLLIAPRIDVLQSRLADLRALERRLPLP